MIIDFANRGGGGGGTTDTTARNMAKAAQNTADKALSELKTKINIVTLSQEEYDNLSDDEKNNPEILYNIV